MSESLALKYRPQSFDDVIGQPMTAVVLDQMVKQEQVPQGLLFSGPSGVGKTTAARILALQMEADVIEIDAASNGGVDQVRKLQEVVRYSTGGAYRVVILDEAQSITRQGFETLLKTLEEPPVGTIFVLVTTEQYKIPRVVLSRLIEFQFLSVTPGAIFDRLKLIRDREGITIEPHLLAFLAQQSEGNVRTAIQGLDMAVRADVTTLEGYRRLVRDQDSAPELLQALTTGNHAHIFEVLDRQLSTVGSPAQVSASLVSCIRDLFILKAGGELRRSGNGLEIRKQLARGLEQDRLLLAVRTLWDIRTKLKGSEDPRGNLELALILVAEAFTRGKTPAPNANQLPESSTPDPVPSSPPRKLTLADLRSS